MVIGMTAIPVTGAYPVDDAEHREDYGGEVQWCSDECDRGKDPWHEAGSVQQRAQQDGVDARHEALSERDGER